MHGNSGVGVVIDAPAADTIDWAAVEAAAARCGPRTRGLVAVRNEAGLREWAARAVSISENYHPNVAAAYRDLAALVGVLPS